MTTIARAGSGAGTFNFAKHFGNNMVLQRAPYKASIHGFSPDVGMKVIVQVCFTIRHNETLLLTFHFLCVVVC